jgi:hypothetical protein
VSGLAATFSASLACGFQLSVTLGDGRIAPPLIVFWNRSSSPLECG